MCKNVLLRGLMPGSPWAFEGIQLRKWRQEQELGSSSRTGDDSLGNFGAATIEKWLGCSVCKTGTGMLAACLGQGCGRTTLSWSSRLWGMGVTGEGRMSAERWKSVAGSPTKTRRRSPSLPDSLDVCSLYSTETKTSAPGAYSPKGHLSTFMNVDKREPAFSWKRFLLFIVFIWP